MVQALRRPFTPGVSLANTRGKSSSVERAAPAMRTLGQVITTGRIPEDLFRLSVHRGIQANSVLSLSLLYMLLCTCYLLLFR